MKSTSSLPRTAISLIELIVVLSVIALLISLLLPAVQKLRAAASQSKCSNNLRQIGIACQSYAVVNNTLPPAKKLGKVLGNRRKVYTWSLLLCPFIEQEAIWLDADANLTLAPGFDAKYHKNLNTVLNVYACPADSRLSRPLVDPWGFSSACSSYVGILGDTPIVNGQYPNGYFPLGVISDWGVRYSEITDGLSNTISHSERPPTGFVFAGSWYTSDIPSDWIGVDFQWHWGVSLYVREQTHKCFGGPFRFGPGRLENYCDSFHIWSLHGGGANFAFADGSVRYISYSAAVLIPSLATRSGGESVTLP
jgi:prepilin-type processing-associated H-X9-DG protein